MNPTVVLRFASPHEIGFDKAEAARYLGWRDTETSPPFDTVEEELRLAVTPKAAWVRLPVTIQGTRLDFGVFSLESHHLSKNLSGCDSVILFAATLGAGADRCILKYGKTAPSRAMLADAVGSAMIEHWCDVLNAELTAGKESKPRYSPGYGDVPLTIQKDILTLLDAQRKLGITLSDTCFMTPTKSVTAFIGLKGEPKP